MKYRQDNNAIAVRPKIHAERKTIGDDSPNVRINDGKLKRVFRRQRDATVNFRDELKTKAKSLAFIPRACFDELRTRATMKRDWQTHCPILARAAAFTLPHEITSSGRAKWSARRRSSSVFCDSVNAGAAPRLAIPFQIASTSSICSSTASTLACSKSREFMISVPWTKAIVTYAGIRALFAACSSTARTCRIVAPGNHSTN